MGANFENGAPLTHEQSIEHSEISVVTSLHKEAQVAEVLWMNSVKTSANRPSFYKWLQKIENEKAAPLIV